MADQTIPPDAVQVPVPTNVTIKVWGVHNLSQKQIDEAWPVYQPWSNKVGGLWQAIHDAADAQKTAIDAERAAKLAANQGRLPGTAMGLKRAQLGLTPGTMGFAPDTMAKAGITSAPSPAVPNGLSNDVPVTPLAAPAATPPAPVPQPTPVVTPTVVVTPTPAASTVTTDGTGSTNAAGG